mgnify:CR=1 FL=1
MYKDAKEKAKALLDSPVPVTFKSSLEGYLENIDAELSRRKSGDQFAESMYVLDNIIKDSSIVAEISLSSPSENLAIR